MEHKTSAAQAAFKPGCVSKTTAFPTLRQTILSALEKPADSRAWASICVAARVVMTPDGRSIRTIITGRRRVATGVYNSRKARRGLVHESMNERAFFIHSEVDTTVLDYMCQPFRFEFVLGGAARIYIADCVRQRADGSLEVIEVKHDHRALRDPDYAQKLEAVRQICQILGWGFRVVHGAPLRERTTRNLNVEAVQLSRFVQYGAREVFAAAELCERAGGMIALGRLAEGLGERRLGTAQACAMMVGRVLDIGLDARRLPDAPVRLVATATASVVGGAA
jgi:hypothetical protein